MPDNHINNRRASDIERISALEVRISNVEQSLVRTEERIYSVLSDIREDLKTVSTEFRELIIKIDNKVTVVESRMNKYVAWIGGVVGVVVVSYNVLKDFMKH